MHTLEQALLWAFTWKRYSASNFLASIMPMLPSSQEKAILTGLVGSQMADSMSLFNVLVCAELVYETILAGAGVEQLQLLVEAGREQH